MGRVWRRIGAGVTIIGFVVALWGASLSCSVQVGSDIRLIGLHKLLVSERPRASIEELSAAGQTLPGAAAGWSETRRTAYGALLATAREDWNETDRLTTELLSLPQGHRDRVAIMAAGGALFRAAKAFESQGNLDRAETLYRQVVALDPTDTVAHGALGDFLEYYRQDIPGAIVQLEIVVQLDPSPRNWLALAARYRYVHRFDEALHLLSQIPKSGEYDEAVVIERAWIALDQRHPAEALQTLLGASQSHPQSAQIRRLLGLTYRMQGRCEEALDAMRLAIRLDPRLTWAYLDATQILLECNRPAEAEGYLQDVLVLSRGDRVEVRALLSLAALYGSTGRADLARQSFCRARELNRWQERMEYIEQQIRTLGGCSKN